MCSFLSYTFLGKLFIFFKMFIFLSYICISIWQLVKPTDLRPVGFYASSVKFLMKVITQNFQGFDHQWTFLCTDYCSANKTCIWCLEKSAADLKEVLSGIWKYSDTFVGSNHIAQETPMIRLYECVSPHFSFKHWFLITKRYYLRTMLI